MSAKSVTSSCRRIFTGNKRGTQCMGAQANLLHPDTITAALEGCGQRCMPYSRTP
jgi:hypothetical protein